METNLIPDVLAVDQRHLDQLVMRLRTGGSEARPKTINSNLSSYRHLVTEDRPYDLVRGIAVLQLRGYLGKSGWWCDTSYDEFSALVRLAVKDPAVETILIDCHSGGGGVYGCADCSDVVFEANKTKRVVSCINDMCASAALWVASAARQMVITQTGDTGSIGVMQLRIDMTESYKKQGISVEVFRAGSEKGWGSPFLPVSDTERKTTQAHIDDTYDKFINAVARNRNVDPGYVRTHWADARIFTGRQAVEVGLVNYLGTFDGVMKALGVSPTVNFAAGQNHAVAAAAPAAPRVARQYLQTTQFPDGRREVRRITKR